MVEREDDSVIPDLHLFGAILPVSRGFNLPLLGSELLLVSTESLESLL
jgi:hypothetical protein